MQSSFADLVVPHVICGLLRVVLFEHLAKVASESRDKLSLLLGLRESDRYRLCFIVLFVFYQLRTPADLVRVKEALVVDHWRD